MPSKYQNYESHMDELLTTIEDAIVTEVQRRCPRRGDGVLANPHAIAAMLYGHVEIDVSDRLGDRIMGRIDELYPQDDES